MPGAGPVYFLTSPRLVREVLVSQANKFDRGRIYDRARPLFGNGLATSDGEFHRKQRRRVQPAFHREHVGGYSDVMSRCSLELADSWHPGQVIEADREMHKLTLKIVAEILFSGNLTPARAEEVHRHTDVVMRGITLRMITPKILNRRPFPQRFDTAAEGLKNLTDRIILEQRRGGDTRNVLAMLLSAHDADRAEVPMSDDQVRDEVISILLAGSETPGTTLSWAMHELSRHSTVEQRLHQEIDAVVGTRPVRPEDVPQLEYTGRVLNEVLRLHPALLFTRRATTAAELDGVGIPSGTEVAYSPYALNRDPALYAEPGKFDPDRWLPHRAAHIPPGMFIPFSAGRHKCLGDAFAWNELIIALATICARWRLRPADRTPVRAVPSAVPRPHALRMITIPRAGQQPRGSG